MTTTADEKRPPARDRLLKLNEVAAIMGVSRQTVSEWESAGFGPPRVVLRGRDVRYRESSLWAWVAAREISGGDRVEGL